MIGCPELLTKGKIADETNWIIGDLTNIDTLLNYLEVKNA